jgi:hypothetical protein
MRVPMVAKIQFPEHDSIEVIARLADERHKYRAFYDKLKPDWLLASKAYIENSGCPLRITPLNLMVAERKHHWLENLKQRDLE